MSLLASHQGSILSCPSMLPWQFCGRSTSSAGKPIRYQIPRNLTLTQRFGCDLIFHRAGESGGTFYKRWKHACSTAGVAGKIPYDLRRAAVRNMIRAGVPERMAKSISRHRTQSIFDRYNIVSEEDLREAVIRTTAYVESSPDAASVVPIKQQVASVSV